VCVRVCVRVCLVTNNPFSNLLGEGGGKRVRVRARVCVWLNRESVCAREGERETRIYVCECVCVYVCVLATIFDNLWWEGARKCQCVCVHIPTHTRSTL